LKSLNLEGSAAHDNPALHELAIDGEGVENDAVCLFLPFEALCSAGRLILFDFVDLETKSTLAWSFLVPRSQTGKLYVGSSGDVVSPISLQLYKVSEDLSSTKKGTETMTLPSEIKSNHQKKHKHRIPSIYFSYRQKRKLPYDNFVTISIGPCDCNAYRTYPKNLAPSENVPLRPKRRQRGEEYIVPKNVHGTIYPAGSSAVLSMSFNNAGTVLAVACESEADDRRHPIHLYDPVVGGLLHVWHGHRLIVYDMRWSHDDARLVTAGADGFVNAWETGRYAASSRVQMEGGFAVAYCLQLAVQPRESKRSEENVENSHFDLLIFVGLLDQSVRLLKMNSATGVMIDGGILGQKLHHNSPVNALEFDSDNQYLYSGDSEGCIIVWQDLKNESIKEISGSNYSVLRRINLKDLKYKAITR